MELKSVPCNTLIIDTHIQKRATHNTQLNNLNTAIFYCLFFTWILILINIYLCTIAAHCHTWPCTYFYCDDYYCILCEYRATLHFARERDNNNKNNYIVLFYYSLYVINARLFRTGANMVPGRKKTLKWRGNGDHISFLLNCTELNYGREQ